MLQVWKNTDECPYCGRTDILLDSCIEDIRSDNIFENWFCPKCRETWTSTFNESTNRRYLEEQNGRYIYVPDY